jgi:hypothetical protein
MEFCTRFDRFIVLLIWISVTRSTAQDTYRGEAAEPATPAVLFNSDHNPLRFEFDSFDFPIVL